MLGSRFRRIGIALVAVGLIAAFFASGDLRARASPAAVRDWLAGSGVWGPVVYCAIFPLWNVTGLPNFLLVVAAGLTWTPLVACVVAWLGCMTSSVIVFGLARGLGRDWFRRRLGHRLESWEARLSTRPIIAVILLRVTFFLAPWASAGLALTNLRTRQYLIGTAVGTLPWIFIAVLLGEGALRLMKAPLDRRAVAIGIGLVIGLIATAAVVSRRRSA